MKTQIDSSPTLKNFLLYGLAYLLWLVNMLVCVAVIIQLRSTVNVFWVALGGDRYSLSMVNQVCLLLGGFVAFVYVMSLENHYRESITHRAEKDGIRNDLAEKASTQRKAELQRRLTDLGLGILLRRFAITTAIPLGVCLAALVALEIALRILQ
jgi:hypothetical protein